MSPAWRGARAVLRLLGGLTLLLLLLCPQAARSDCSLPPDLPNAQPALEGLTSFPEQSTVTYKCNKGFVKVPGKPDSVVCLKNNEWSQIAEFCNRSCDVPTRLLFASLKQPYNKQNYFPVGSTVEYECRMGYKRNHSLSGKLTCLQNFMWSKPDEFCQKKSCPHPGEITNGHFSTTDISFGASIIFSCNAGYKLVGATSSYCILVGKNVEWSDPLPECKEISQISKVTPTPQKPTTVNIPGTETSSTPQKPATVNIPATKAPSTPQKSTRVNAPATNAPPTPQKPATVNIPATKAPSTPQKPTRVNVPATNTPPSPQKPTTVNIPATKAPSTPQKPTRVNAPATNAPPTPQKPTTVNIPTSKAPSTPKIPTTVNAPAIEASSTPQKPTTVNVPATEASSTPQKHITANDSATTAKISPVSNTLSIQTPPPATQTPIMANISATQVTVTQKSTAVHTLVTKGLPTTQRLTSAHITATQSQAVPRATTPFHARTTSFHAGTLPAGVSTIASGLVAGTIIIGTLILVKIFWDYGKSGSYYTREDSKSQNVMFHNLTVTADASEVRPSGHTFITVTVLLMTLAIIG